MTPLIKIGQIYFKREDQNITGSAKDRAIPSIIEGLKKQGFTKAVISSTGNAAISAQYFCNLANIELIVFISPKTNRNKISLIKNPITSDKPISDAFKYAKKNNAYLIRLSTDPETEKGYQIIGKEILEQLPEVTSIFVPTGSGATIFGIYKSVPRTVNLIAVQPASHCPIASHYDKDYIPESDTITDALGAKLLPLKSIIFDTINSGAVVQNANLIKAQEYLEKNNIITSAEGALALAGYTKYKNYLITGDYPVILLTGAKR